RQRPACAGAQARGRRSRAVRQPHVPLPYDLMDIHETRVGAAVVLEPEGNLTTNPDAQALERKITALLDAQVRQIVIDGGQVGQIGSGAVRVLLLVTRKMDRVGGRV